MKAWLCVRVLHVWENGVGVMVVGGEGLRLSESWDEREAQQQKHGQAPNNANLYGKKSL